MKMSKLLILLLSTSVIWGECIVEVKKANITLKINDKTKILKKNKNLKIEGDTKICLVDGNGSIDLVCEGKTVFTNLTSKDKDCIATQSSSGFVKAWKGFIAYFKHVPELLVMGSSTRGGDNSAINEKIELSKNQKSFIIEDTTWAPTPTTLTIYDSNDKNKKVYTSKNSNLTRFKIPVSSLKRGDRLIITNKYGQKMAEFIIDIKD